MRTKKYALQGTYPREKRGEGPFYFALFKKGEIGILASVWVVRKCLKTETCYAETERALGPKARKQEQGRVLAE